MPLLMCPNCNLSMQSVSRSGVEFDMCPNCRGVWLDRGELEKIIAEIQPAAPKNDSWPTQPGQAAQPPYPQPGHPQHPQQGYPSQGGYPQQPYRRDYDDDDDRYDDDRRRGRRKGFNLFDIFD